MMCCSMVHCALKARVHEGGYVRDSILDKMMLRGL